LSIARSTEPDWEALEPPETEKSFLLLF
jgi:hypothetical protein